MAVDVKALKTEVKTLAAELKAADKLAGQHLKAADKLRVKLEKLQAKLIAATPVVE